MLKELNDTVWDIGHCDLFVIWHLWFVIFYKYFAMHQFDYLKLRSTSSEKVMFIGVSRGGGSR